MELSGTDRTQSLIKVHRVQVYEVVHIGSSPRTMLQKPPHHNKARI